MRITLYPTLEEALFLHQELIKRHGGSFGVRDLGLLESALARPRSGYYDTLSAQAAALIQSLALNHPFVDGNKRLAFALTATFLHMNGFEIKVTPKVGESFLINKIVLKKIEIDAIARWLEKLMQKVS